MDVARLCGGRRVARGKDRHQAVERLIREIATWDTVLSEEEMFQVRTGHHFHDDIYLRTYFMKAGETTVGRLHKESYLTVQAYGHCVVGGDTDTPEEIEGFRVWTSRKGEQRAVYSHVDTMWLTVHHHEKVEDKDSLIDVFFVKDRATYDRMIEDKRTV